MTNIKIKINIPLKKYNAGDIVNIAVFDEFTEDGNYKPKDVYWRRRFKDAETDGCLEVIDEYEYQLLKEEQLAQQLNE